jgi:rhodanese-related sulfurtransferase
MSKPFEISPTEVQQRIAAGEALTLIDVRELPEHEICRINGATLIPMNEIPKQLENLRKAEPPLIVFCHHGVRSLRVVSWLREQGIADCASMSGGIEAWSLQVDPSVPRY